MNPETLAVFNTAQEAVTRLVEVCHKQHSLYGQNPRAVAQVSRNAKWLLHAIDRLHHDFNAAERNAS